MPLSGPIYGSLQPEDYRIKVNSPSESLAFFENFIRPMLEEAKNYKNGSIRLFDLGCGFGAELQFMQGDERIDVVGLDLSEEVLNVTRQKVKGLFMAGDAESPPAELGENFADAGLAVNAMIYKPDHMLRCLYGAARPGAPCVTNFRISNEKNAEFYEYCRTLGCQISSECLTFFGEKFDCIVIDYTASNDPSLRGLNKQTYFNSADDIERLIRLSHFAIEDRQEFAYETPAVRSSVTDVYRLRKRQP